MSTVQVTTPGQTLRERTSYAVLMMISFCHFLNDMIQSLLPAIYPILKGNYHLDFGQVGMITFTNQLTASVLQPVVGTFTDKRPQPFSLSIGMGFTLVGLVMLSTATSYPLILAAAAMVGIGSSVFHPESSRVARMASGGQHGFAQSIFQVGGNAGSALGPLLAAFIVLPHGQASLAWFSLAALLGMGLLGKVGVWAKRYRAARALAPKHAIGFAGKPAADLDTLRRLQRLHPRAIPFENLSPLLGEPVKLDPASLEDKLVARRRGGWCFEQNLYFTHVLRAIGFEVKTLAARVRWNVPAGVTTSRSHMLMRVAVEGEPYIADVGFGGLVLTGPLRLEAGIEAIHAARAPSPRRLGRGLRAGSESRGRMAGPLRLRPARATAGGLRGQQLVPRELPAIAVRDRRHRGARGRRPAPRPAQCALFDPPGRHEHRAEVPGNRRGDEGRALRCTGYHVA